EGTVVEVALGIASYTYGGLLGVFLFGLINKEASERAAIVGFITALVSMAFVIAKIQIAWPLYTVVGSIVAILVGTLYSKLGDNNAS
ncbi:MAG: sodium:solute symporter, partial [Calditrichota bacterium]